MQEKLLQRLEELRLEFEIGQKMMIELDAKQVHLKSSLLRISGAIQVLEELLNQELTEEQKRADDPALQPLATG